MEFIHKGNSIESVSFVGFGRSNAAVYAYLKKAYPFLKFSVRTEKEEKALPNEAEVFMKDEQFEKMTEDVFFISPAIRKDKAELNGKLLSSDAELFFERNESDCFGITGSDGKSTTSTLTAMMLGGKYQRSEAIGNIGKALCEALDGGNNTAYAVELSSFQLMDFSPKLKRAIITNITPNHLNWHTSYKEYASAKENVLRGAEQRVFSADSDAPAELIEKYGAFAIISTELTESELKRYKAQTYIYKIDDTIYIDGEKLISKEDFLRQEEYNLKNFMAAMALSYGSWDKDLIYKSAKSFPGLAHRCELCADFSSVKFYNSSIDSSPQRSLTTLSSHRGRFVAVLGGRTKMNNFDILREIIAKNAHALVLTGENRGEVHAKLSGIGVPIYVESDFKRAILCGAELAKKCGSLILSPASTSFDRFKSFEERGEYFRRIVSELHDKGF